MNTPRIKYFLDEAKKNIVRNGLMSVASVFTIISCLIILGLFIMISLNVQTISNQIKDQCEIQVYIEQDASEDRVAKIHDEILKIDNVKDCELYTKSQMLEDVKDTMFEGREDLVESFSNEDNPFSDSYKVVLTDISKAKETAENLQKIKDIESVTNKQDLVNIILSLSKNINHFTIAIMILLLTVAIVIISNTVRMTVFNRRKEIEIMKYIGATDRFIRVPFLFEGIIIGFIGAVISFALITGGYWILLKYVSASNFNLFTFVPLVNTIKLLAVVFVGVGCLIGAVGSAVSMRKYLSV